MKDKTSSGSLPENEADTGPAPLEQPGADTDKLVDIMDRRLVHDGFLRVFSYCLRHIRSDGHWSQPMVREIVKPRHAAAVLPYDPRHNAVIMIEQFRVASFIAGQSAWQTEAIGGQIDHGETVLEALARELREEAGLPLIDPVPMFTFQPGVAAVASLVHLFTASVDSTKAGGVFGVSEEQEETRVLVMSPETALARQADGRLMSAGAIAGLYWLLLNRQSLATRWARSEPRQEGRIEPRPSEIRPPQEDPEAPSGLCPSTGKADIGSGNN